MGYQLPTSITVGGKAYKIRSDYRAALDIFAALADLDLSEKEKSYILLKILYVDFNNIPANYYCEALKEALNFLNCGNQNKNETKKPPLVDWAKDFQYIVAPVNRVIGKEIRSLEYLHWWSFVSAYYEIGDCTFAQIVRIRSLKAKKKKLDKTDEAWYRENRDIVDLKTRYSEKEEELLAAWTK